MFGFQTQLIFPTHAVPRAGPLPTGGERLSLKLRSGETLAGVHLPPARKAAGGATLVLVFAGNAWNSQEAATYVHEIYPDTHVVAFHYRGYPPSGGSPSAEALIADAPLVFDFAKATVRPRRIVAVGLSIGSAVAAQLSAQRDLDGIILVTPFDSLQAVAQDMYPWVPLGPFFQHDIDAAEVLRRNDVPAAIIAGQDDDLVRPARTEALRRSTRNLVFDRTIPRAGHNDIYARSDFHAAMRQALSVLIS